MKILPFRIITDRLKVLWMASLFLCLVTALDGQVPGNESLKKAANRFAETWLPGYSRNAGTVLELPGEEGNSLAVVSLEPEGWILMSRDLRVQPVLGFSPTGHFIPGEIKGSEAFTDWLSHYHRQIATLPDKKAWTIHPEWESLSGSGNSLPKSTSSITVEPLITAEWNQGSGWNQFCPADPEGPGGHALVGCVGVAMAQAMTVFRWPDSGAGISSYTHDSYGTISLDHGSVTFDWDHMPDKNSNVQNATLLYHCAVAVSMNFGPTSSSAKTSQAGRAMSDHFLYSNNIYYSARGSDLIAWRKLLNEQLEAGRPVIYRGSSPDIDTGHAFNIDGVINGTYYHINWGWSGNYNGYFSLNLLNPGSRNYTDDQAAVFNIQPLYYPTDILLSSYLVELDQPAGTLVGELEVVDEASDNEYFMELEADSSYSAGVWKPDYLLDGDHLLTNRVFSAGEPATDTVYIHLTDRYGHELNLPLVLGIGSIPAGIDGEMMPEPSPQLVYPNPVRERLFLSAHESGWESLRIYSITGKLIREYHRSECLGGIDVSRLENGIYILETRKGTAALLRSRFIKTN